MKIIAVLNSKSGTLRNLDLPVFIAQAEADFTAAGHHLRWIIADGDGIITALQQAAENSACDVLLAGGGDGTISAAAAFAWKNNKILGVLPAGTMNLFARSLNVPQNIEDATKALARADIHHVDIGTCNGQAFVHQVAIGLHPAMIRYREQYNYSSRSGKIRANLRALTQVLTNIPRIKAEIITGERKITGVYSAIAVSNNPYGDSALPVAPDIQTGHLGFYLAKPLTTGGMVKLFWDILCRRWRSNMAIEEQHTSSVSLKFLKHKPHKFMSLDGELLPLPPELDIHIHPSALKVLAPL